MSVVRLHRLSNVRLQQFFNSHLCVSGARWHDWICAVPDGREVLQDPVHMSLQAAVCCGPGPGRRNCTGKDLIVSISISSLFVVSQLGMLTWRIPVYLEQVTFKQQLFFKG